LFFGFLIVNLFVGANLSHKQFRRYWLLIVLTLHLTTFLGCAAVSLATGYEIELLDFLLRAIVMGILTFVFWGFFSIFMFDS
jgi:hypothetical protein